MEIINIDRFLDLLQYHTLRPSVESFEDVDGVKNGVLTNQLKGFGFKFNYSVYYAVIEDELKLWDDMLNRWEGTTLKLKVLDDDGSQMEFKDIAALVRLHTRIRSFKNIDTKLLN